MVSLLQANEQLDGFTCMSGMSANATSERLFFFFLHKQRQHKAVPAGNKSYTQVFQGGEEK